MLKIASASGKAPGFGAFVTFSRESVMTFKENGLSAFRISLLAAAVGTSGHVIAQEESGATELDEIQVTAEKEGP
jgi:hypothetical protein